MAKIKYLGSADRVTIKKGENFAGRLATPTTTDLVWEADKGHLLDTEGLDLSPEAIELLLEDKVRFKDVSDLQRIPTSLNEQIFRGMPKSEADSAAEEPLQAEVAADASTDAEQAKSATKTGARSGASATSATAGTTTTVGGSTAGTP